MAFSNGFNGDVVSLNYILKTLERKQVFIPGITSNSGVSVTAAGESAYYYARGATSVNTGNVGAKHTYVSSGVTRVTIDMNNSVNIDSVIPYANYKTVSADVVGDKVIQETIEQANKLNEAMLTALCTSTGTVTGTAALTASTVYAAIVAARKEFITINKAKGLNPTAIIVGPTIEALLLQSAEFQRVGRIGDDVVSDAYISDALGMKFIRAVDLDETTSKIDFIIMHADGFGAPTNVNTLNIVDSTPAGYPGGTLIAGEIGYGTKVTDNNLVLIRKHA